MGDMIVKQGDPATARRVYANAKLSKTYQAWPFKPILDDRIAQADEKSRFSARSSLARSTMMISSTFACMGCHQQ
jgi:hypothetical protein